MSARGTGAVTFIQRFGSAVQLNVHFHVLVPKGLFDAQGGLHPLPPPGDEEVQATLLGLLRELGPLLLRHGLDELEALPEDALDGRRLRAAQARLPLGGCAGVGQAAVRAAGGVQAPCEYPRARE